MNHPDDSCSGPPGPGVAQVWEQRVPGRIRWLQNVWGMWEEKNWEIAIARPRFNTSWHHRANA